MLKIAKDLFDVLYPVGTYYETSNANWTPSSAGWYGTWVEDTDGKVTVAKDNGTFKTLGSVVGSETHTLSVDEIPSHSHTEKYVGVNWFQPGASGDWCISAALAPYRETGNTGGDKPHNNIQPSVVVIRWHRTA